MGELRALDRSGDGLRISWSADNEREVAEVRRHFDDYKNRGFTLYRLEADDRRGPVMREFDPHAGTILAVPRMVGG